MRKRYRAWILRRRVRRARILLKLIDNGIAQVGMPRNARRRLWRDFLRSTDHSEIIDLLQNDSIRSGVVLPARMSKVV